MKPLQAGYIGPQCLGIVQALQASLRWFTSPLKFNTIVHEEPVYNPLLMIRQRFTILCRQSSIKLNYCNLYITMEKHESICIWTVKLLKSQFCTLPGSLKIHLHSQHGAMAKNITRGLPTCSSIQLYTKCSHSHTILMY